jgi:DNA-binding XRE family transcriptional regulator
MTTATTSSAFGALLRDWRQRRRLTQLGLGLQADVSARHLSFLETGRSRPSRDMVLHLAEELDVPLRARNELMTAAATRPPTPSTTSTTRSWPRCGRRCGGSSPATSPTRRCSSTGRGTCSPPTPRCRCSPRSSTGPAHPAGQRHAPGPAPARVRRHVVDLPGYAAHLVSRLRRQAERLRPHRAARLVRELTAYCRELGLDPHAQPPGAGPSSRIVLPLRLRHPRAGELALFSTVSVLGAPLDVTLDEVAIESFFPADDRTAAFLRASCG